MIQQRGISGFLREAARVLSTVPDEPPRDGVFGQVSDVWAKFLEQEGEVSVNIAGVTVCSSRLVLLDETLHYLVQAFHCGVLSQGAFLSATAQALSLFLEDQDTYFLSYDLFLPRQMIEAIELQRMRCSHWGKDINHDWKSLDTYAIPIDGLHTIPDYVLSN